MLTTKEINKYHKTRLKHRVKYWKSMYEAKETYSSSNDRVYISIICIIMIINIILLVKTGG